MNELKLIRKVFHSIFDGAYPDRHRVLLMWKGPIAGELCHRSAAFEEYTDAELYALSLKDRYLTMGFPFVIYLDGYMFCAREA